MKRRNFLSSLLGIPLIARFLPAAEAPKTFWAGTTIPRSEPMPISYWYSTGTIMDTPINYGRIHGEA